MRRPSHTDHRPPVDQDPATAAAPPHEFGYLYPEHDVLAVVGDRATGERALAALRDAGLPDGDMALLEGRWFLERMRRLRTEHPLLQRLALSDESDIIRGYQEAAESGEYLLSVHADEPPLVERVRQVLVRLGARRLHHWERFTITELSERVPDRAAGRTSAETAGPGPRDRAPLDPCAEEIARLLLEGEQRAGF